MNLIISIVTCTASALAAIIVCTFFEWWLHKNIMHKIIFGFTYAFDAHARIHHQTFKADHTYHLQEGPEKEKHKKTIPMAWWNGPVLVFITTIPFLLMSLTLGYWPIFLTSAVVGSLYYAAYEYMHWCMHLPKARKLELWKAFYLLNGHHLIHHRYMGTNFNVVLPFADWCLGTLKVRADTRFKQATGPSVPDVQPLATPASTMVAA